MNEHELYASQIAEHIAESEKYQKHIVERKEFTDEKYGKQLPVQSKEEYRQHIYDTLVSKDTQCFTVQSEAEKGKVHFFYNGDTNTYAVVPENWQSSPPTAFRPEEHDKKFEDKIIKQTVEQGYAPEIKHGIQELIGERAREQKSFAQSASLQNHDNLENVAANAKAAEIIANMTAKNAESTIEIGAANPRTISPEEFSSSVEAKREYYAQEQAALDRDNALDDIAKNGPSEDNLKYLYRDELQQIAKQGDAVLERLIQERQEELQRSREGGRGD